MNSRLALKRDQHHRRLAAEAREASAEESPCTGRNLNRPQTGGSRRDARRSSTAASWFCRRIGSEHETKRLRRPCPSCSPRARSCAASVAAVRGPTSLEGPGCPFIRRFIHCRRVRSGAGQARPGFVAWRRHHRPCHSGHGLFLQFRGALVASALSSTTGRQL